MKINQILIQTTDLESSTTFYKNLGFVLDFSDKKVANLRLNDFTIQLIDNSQSTFPIEAEKLKNFKSEGFYIFIEVDDVDKFYNEIIAKGIKTSTQPKTWEWGNREFVVRDPNGYALIFYKKV